MNLVELKRSMTTLRLGGMAETVETRIIQAQSEKMVPLDFISALVGDELIRPLTDYRDLISRITEHQGEKP